MAWCKTGNALLRRSSIMMSKIFHQLRLLAKARNAILFKELRDARAIELMPDLVTGVLGEEEVHFDQRGIFQGCLTIEGLKEFMCNHKVSRVDTVAVELDDLVQ